MEIIALIAAYLVGSIPFGLLLVRAAGLGDVRNIGSGNIGATNVMRTGNKKLGIATLLLDAGKGYLAMLVGAIILVKSGFHLEAWVAPALGLAAIIGHIFPIWLKFKGGKGVATTFGVLCGMSPSLLIIPGTAWILAASITRYVSLASVFCFWVFAIIMSLNGVGIASVFSFTVASLITWTHRANIKRIREGTEPKIGKKKV